MHVCPCSGAFREETGGAAAGEEHTGAGPALQAPLRVRPPAAAAGRRGQCPAEGSGGQQVPVAVDSVGRKSNGAPIGLRFTVIMPVFL